MYLHLLINAMIIQYEKERFQLVSISVSRNVKDKKKMSNAILALFRIQCDEPKSNAILYTK